MKTSAWVRWSTDSCVSTLWPKQVGVIHVMVMVSRSIGRTLENTCLAEYYFESVLQNPGAGMFGPPCCMSFPSPSTQESIREERVETACQVSPRVQRRTQLANQTLPAIFVGAIALDVKKH